MKHVLLHQNWLTGWQYGPHKALEDEIIKQTSADVVAVAKNDFEQNNARMQHGRPLNFLRKYIPKMTLPLVEADVAWHVLMGPGDYKLDLYNKWYKNIKHRVVYVFDTLQPLEKAMIHAFSDDTFTIRITSINEAVPWLEKITGQKWYGIEMAAPDSLFNCPPPAERLIPFACYGRKLQSFHNVLMEFVRSNNLYFDYTTCNGTLDDKFDPYSYNHYAWHVTHSMFNICWPVEVTSPNRAGLLRPITPRWYEAAAAGTCILGKKPDNPFFDDFLHPDIVVDIDPFQEKKIILKSLDKIWTNREEHIQFAMELRLQHFHRWTWKNRVERMLNLLSEVD